MGEGVEVWLYSFFTSALDVRGWSMPRLGRFTARKRVAVVQEAGWAPGQVWTGAEKRKSLSPPVIQR